MELTVLPSTVWAEHVAQELAARLRQEPRLRLCLPTGDTPAPVYDRLLELNRLGRAPFGQATVLLLDEYVGLAPSDPARCDARLRRELLDKLATGPAAFHPLLVDELAPEAAAATHDALAAEGLDLLLLGLGLNGHVGLNEPGSTADSPTRVVKLADASRQAATSRYAAAEPPRRGITLGLAPLLKTAEIWLLVRGEHKREVPRRTLQAGETTDCPASFLLRHARLRVFADDQAASSVNMQA